MSSPGKRAVTAVLTALVTGAMAGPAWAVASPSEVALGHKEATEINLTARDLPGWASSPNISSSHGSGLSRRLALCTGAPDPAKADISDVNSPAFDKGNADVNSNVTVAVNRAVARKGLAALRSSRFPSCVQKELPLMKSELAPATLVKLTLTAHLRAQWLPAASFAYRMHMQLRVSKATEMLQSDAYGFLVGRTVVELTATYVGARNLGLEARLGKLLVQRAHKYAQ